MLQKQELQALHNLLSRPGFKIDITETEAVSLLKHRIAQELNAVTEAEQKAMQAAKQKPADVPEAAKTPVAAAPKPKK